MIDELKPYSAYCDSGVEWLGEVPAHWEVRRLKTLLHERSERGYPDEPLLAATQIKGVVRKDRYENRTVLALKDLHLLKLVRVGDFVISLRSFQGGIEYARDQGIISPAYTVLYPTDPSTHGYLAWLFKSQPFIAGLSLFVTGIRQGQNIDYARLSRSSLALPPVNEQAAIARFLGHADRKIRRYIRAKQRLIELLEEQKQAVIHRAVTRGLDPDVRLKPSGVEWLGDVPEHWEIRSLRHCGSILGGMTPSKENRSYWGGTTPWVTPKDMKRFRIGDSMLRVTNEALRSTSLQMIPAGSVLLVVRGMILARRVPVAMVTAPVTINQDMKALSVREGISGEFLALAMGAAREAFAGLIDEAGHGTKRLPTERWREVAVALPPYDEQEEIADFLRQATADIDSALSSTDREVGLMQEYRTRLISDVVTGKLDVRAAAAKQPADGFEEVDELDPDEPFGTGDAGEEDLAGELEEVEV